jgi:hypothetical protein
MADIQVLRATMAGGRVATLEVQMIGVAARTISRETALAWLAGGHSMIPVAGHGHDLVRGAAIERVEVGDEPFIRTDTRPEPEDVVEFPVAHH